MTVTPAPFLTIGFVCYNDAARIDQTIRFALDIVARRGPQRTELLLVNNASTDSTGAQLEALAQAHTCVRVLHVEGEQNAAVGRNVLLDSCRAGPIFLVDSDVTIDANFVEKALDELHQPGIDAVYGKLPEIQYNADGQRVGDTPDRYRVTERHFPGWFKGVVMLSSAVVASGLRYNERFARLEDIEYALRVSERFTIVAIPEVMGTHHTIAYHSRWRLREFIRERYQRPAGQLIRRYLHRPLLLWRVRRAFMGYAAGAVLLTGLALSVLLGLWPGIVGFVCAIGIDVLRFALQRRLHEYPALRLVGPLQLLSGLLLPAKKAPTYRVRETPVAATTTH